MVMMILKDKCKIERYVKGEKSPTGAVKTTLKTIVEFMPCYFEPDDGIIIVPQEGQTAVYYYNMFCDIGTDLQANDIVTNLVTGEKFKVINYNDYRILPHLEVRLQGGTVK
jgi:hypothetical protein